MSNAPALKKSELVDSIKNGYLSSSAMSFLGDDKNKANEILAGFLYTANKNPKVYSCTKASIMLALNQCSQFGLVAGAKQECALIPYFNNDTKVMELSFQPMVAGIIKTAYDSGFVSQIDCEIIHEFDFFEYEQGTDTKLTFRKNLFGERGKVLGGYCVITLKDGGKIIEVMPEKDIKKIENSAKTKKIWIAHWSEMARKTVIKRALKRVVKSKQIAELIEHDNQLERPDYSEQNRAAVSSINAELLQIEDTGVIDTETNEDNQEEAA